MSFALIKRGLRSLSWRPRRSSPHLLLGSRGERAAARYLKRHGYRILARNFRCAVGEIDLICAPRGFIVFVEVKTRTSATDGDLLEACRTMQWRRIERAAEVFLSRLPERNQPCRFDLVTVVWPARGAPVLEHFEDVHHPGER